MVYAYEPECIKFSTNGIARHYLPDFQINNKFFEIKSDLAHYDKDKYDLITQAFGSEVPTLTVADYSHFCEKLNLNKLSDNDIFSAARNLLDLNELDISYCLRRGAKSKILSKIYCDYEHHDRIHLYIIEQKEVTTDENKSSISN